MLNAEDLYAMVNAVVVELTPQRQYRRTPVEGEEDLHHTLTKLHGSVIRAEIVKDRHIVRAYVSDDSYVDIKIMVTPDNDSRWYWSIGRPRTSLTNKY